MAKNTDQVVDALIKALHDRPETFGVTTYSLTDRLTNIRVFDCRQISEPIDLKFNFFQRRRFRRAFNSFAAAHLCALIQNGASNGSD